jgi:hypothetical protein
MYREVTMVEITEVLRLWRDGLPKKRIAARLGLDPKTVRRYLTTAEAVGLRRDGGAITEAQVRDVLLALHPAGGRPRGDGWARCREQQATIQLWLQQDIRLTKIRKLLARQGVVITYATLHRFAVVTLNFGRAATTIPVVDGAPGEELQVDHGLGRLAHAHGPEAPLSRVDLHRRPLALSVCLSDVRGDDGPRHRGVRGRLDLLRRCLQGPHSG